MRYAVIMAGGTGTRLWPMSRKKRPKQLLPLIDGQSLIGLASKRLEGVVPPEQRLICTGEVHSLCAIKCGFARPLIARTLRSAAPRAPQRAITPSSGTERS